MNVETTIRVMRLGWPSLFSTRFEALHHLFCVNGNGYEWMDGELIGVGKDDTFEAATEIVMCEHDHRMPFDRIDREIEAARNSGRLSLWEENPRTFHWYPLCEYACLMNVPADVKPDWRAAVIEIVEIMVQATPLWLQDCAMENKKYAEKALQKLKKEELGGGGLR